MKALRFSIGRRPASLVLLLTFTFAQVVPGKAQQGVAADVTRGPANAEAGPPPAAAERVAKAAPSNQSFASKIAKADGRASVLFFVEGPFCVHCLSQLTEMSAPLASARADVSVISASTEEELTKFPKTPFRLIADPERRLAREYGAFDARGFKHATIVHDASGRETLRKIGDEPFMNVSVVVSAFNAASPRVVIAVRGTDASEDDYLTWAPTLATIRVENGDASGPDLSVILSNDAPTSIPEGGDVAFAEADLGTGQTATKANLVVQLKQDGTPVKVFVAGTKASKLTKASLENRGRDAVIEARENVVNGRLLGQTAVMVRVRKRMDTLNPVELDEVMTAINDLHRVQNRYEWYVLLHRLATGHNSGFGDPPDQVWSDQAHKGPAFIAWHRAFLLQFERELQLNFPWVALPYWSQGATQTFFDAKRFGINSAGAEIVTFDTASPLYGWSIDTLHHDGGTGSGIMGLLRRAPLDHNLANGDYQQWGTRLEGKPNYKDALPKTWGNLTNPFGFNIERNPHDKGHGLVGPPLVWMENCRESNADPVFWVFHCNHDYLWARWQYYHDRFRADGFDPAHFWPNDGFADAAADRTIPLGHHLRDTMWPWDGTTGEVIAGQPLSVRPNVNNFGAFPASPAPGLWPKVEAKPTPADTIDYLGLASRETQLGFCYDDVAWGFRPPAAPIPIPVAPAVLPADADLPARAFLNKQANPDFRKSVVAQLRRDPSSLESKKLIEVVRERQTASTLRSDALGLLAQLSAEDAFSEAVSLLSSRDTPAALSAVAIDHIGSALHFSQHSHDTMRRATEALTTAMKSNSAGAVRASALRMLATRGDATSKAALLAGLSDPSGMPITATEAVALLRFFPDQRGALRGHLDSANDDIACAAIQALHHDAETEAKRRQIATDRGRGPSVRRAAVQSLMYGTDPKNAETLVVSVFAEAADDLNIRAEAIASARVFFQRASARLNPSEKEKWAQTIQAVPTDNTGPGSLGELKLRAANALQAKR